MVRLIALVMVAIILRAGAPPTLAQTSRSDLRAVPFEAGAAIETTAKKLSHVTGYRG